MKFRSAVESPEKMISGDSYIVVGASDNKKKHLQNIKSSNSGEFTSIFAKLNLKDGKKTYLD